ncbi:MAG: hypothetical protein FWC43_10765 [Planctomycetaceae bacterium]|nr:hypothetical protein [Planctomycetaceae bacterium]
MRIHSILLCVLAFAFCTIQGFGQEEGWVSPDGPAVVMNQDPTGYVQQVSVLIQTEVDEEDEGELVAPQSDIDTEKSSDSDVVVNTEKAKNEKPTEKPVEKPKRTLSPELVKLREQITEILATNAKKRPLELQKDSPASVIAYCFAYGADTQVIQVLQTQQQPGRQPQVASRTPVFAIGALCWNYPSGGKTLLRADGKNIIAKVGPGLQRKPGALLAMLAMSSVAESYEVRVGDVIGSIADLIQAEKAACSADADMSLALIGLSFYCDVEEEWTNEFGEKWSIPKMVDAELLHPADQGTSNITDQLLGLACAVRRFESEGIELTGPMLVAKNWLERGTNNDPSFEKFALSVQNEQGLWHPRFFLFKGSTTNPWDSLYSSGHIFRFLAFSLSEEKLTDPLVVRSAKALADLISNPKVANTPATTERQVEALATALHALAIYNERLGD